MKSTQFSSNLIQLTRFGLINCFLVREAVGVTLIDTGIAGSGKAILEAAKQHGSQIVRIVLTHAHSDHTGSLDELHEALPQAEVLISARDARFLAGDMSLDANEPQAKLRGGYNQVQTKPTRLLQEGDRIGSLEAIAAPGHTPGQLAFLDVRDRTLIVGDAYYAVGGLSVVTTMRWWFPLPTLATWHGPTAIETARKLRSLNPAMIAVGHGRTTKNPVAAMDKALQVATGASTSAAQ